jgi:eukaryotic-like serine/threonine-protein kinase
MRMAVMSPDTLIAGKYRLVSRIGQGAMGEVWAAINVSTDRQVALKLISSSDPELSRRLLREARAMGRLDHPNIVQILDRGETSAGEPFLVMQLLQGETLGQRLRRERTLSQAIAAGIALDIALALRVAHGKQIIHRDLKPGNIFLHRELDTEDDIVKVVDFGVSKLTLDGDAGTMTQDIVGSPAYMSPEQIHSSGVDGRTDVWALGVMLFEMLAGRRPFPGTQTAVVIGQILTQPVPRVETAATNVSRAMGDVIAGCLERDLDRRIGGAAELIRALRPLAPRTRFAAAEDSDARGRFTSLPDAPTPPAAPDAEGPRESDPATAVFRPGMLPGAPPVQPQQHGAKGTVLMTPRPPEPPSTGRDSDIATGIFRPSMLQPGSHPKPPLAERDSQPTSLFQPAALQSTAESADDLESERPTAEIRPAPPPPPPRPLVTMGTDQRVSPPDAPEHKYDVTVPLHGAVPAPIVRAPRHGTVPLDPSVPPATPTARTRVPELSEVATELLPRPFVPVDALNDAVPRRAPRTNHRLTILLGIALGVFIVIVTLLVITLTEPDHPSPSPGGSASAVGSGSVATAAAPATASAAAAQDDPEVPMVPTPVPPPNTPTALQAPKVAPASRRPSGTIIRRDPWGSEPEPAPASAAPRPAPSFGPTRY